MSMPPALAVLSTGQPEKRDPQFGGLKPFPPANVGDHVIERLLSSGKALRLVAWATPGHAPGSTSWRGAAARARCCRHRLRRQRDRGRATAIASPTIPQYVAAFRSSLGLIGNLGCGLLITPHPGASNLIDRLGTARRR